MKRSLIAVVLLLSACGGTAEAEDAGGTRTVQTFLGAVEVPEKIESVVVLDGRRDQDIALALDLPVVGVPRADPEHAYELAKPLAAAVAAAAPEELFLENEVNLEALAETAPDLIICHEDDLQDLQTQLQAIAPVLVVAASPEDTWQEDLLMVGEATGTTAKAEQLIADYDARVGQIRQEFGDEIAGTKVTPFAYDAEGTAIGGGRLHSRVLQDVGAVPSKAFAQALADPENSLRSSPEQTLEAHSDADALLVAATSSADWEGAAADPLFQELPAVQAGRVVRTDRLTFQGGPITAMHVLDLVEQLYAS